MMTDEEKRLFQERIRHKVNIKNAKVREAKAKKETAAAKERAAKILDRHQKRIRKDDLVKLIFRLCRKMSIDAKTLAISLGLKGFVKSNSLDDLEMMAEDVQQRFELFENDKLKD